MKRTKVIHSVAVVALPLSLLLLAATSCTPEAYRHDADREVSRILSERKKTTLGYEPQSAVSDAPAPTVQKSDYRKIPATALPPSQPPALATPGLGAVPFGVLGPDRDVKPVKEGYTVGSLGSDEEGETSGAGRGLVAGPPMPAKNVSRLDLFGSLKYAVQNSRDYRDKMEDLYLSALDVTLARHLFAPRPFASIGAEYNGGQASTAYQSALAATATVGVKQQLPYGGEIDVSTLVKFVDAIEGNVEDGESADIALTGSIPLLRGAGMVNLDPLISSERDLIYAVRTFEAYRRSFAVTIASQYFDLLAQQQAISNRLQNYATLASLLERARALYDARRLSALEVQRAEQSLLSGENTLIDARLDYANALDNFKIALGMNVNDRLDVVPVEIEVAIPDIKGTVGIEDAYRYRLELQTAKDQVADAVRKVDVTKNGLLPDLTLTGKTSVGNPTDFPAKNLDSRTLQYSAGINLDLPVDRVAERNAYRRSLISFDRAQRDLADLKDKVTAQVRADARGIRLARSTLVIQRQSISLAERRLDLATTRLRLGVQGADTREVVEAQEDLLNAQDAYQQAQANLQIQVLAYLRDTGTLRVDPDAGELGQAFHRQPDSLQAGTGQNDDVNARRATQ